MFLYFSEEAPRPTYQSSYITERISDDDDEDFEVRLSPPATQISKPSEPETPIEKEPELTATATTEETLQSAAVVSTSSNENASEEKAENLIGHESNDVIEDRSSTNQTPSKWDDKAIFKDSTGVYKSVEFDNQGQSTPVPSLDKGDFGSSEENQPKEEKNEDNLSQAEKPEKEEEEPTVSLDQSEATTIEIEDPKKDSSGSQFVSDSLDLPDGKPKHPDDPTEIEVSSDSSSNKDTLELNEPTLPEKPETQPEIEALRLA